LKNRFVSDDLSDLKGIDWIRRNYDSIDVRDWNNQEMDYVLSLALNHLSVNAEPVFISYRQWGLIPESKEHPNNASRMVVFPQYSKHKEFLFALMESFPDRTKITTHQKRIDVRYEEGRIFFKGKTAEAIHSFATELYVYGVELEPEENSFGCFAEIPTDL
jgi:hypothetical protein